MVGGGYLLLAATKVLTFSMRIAGAHAPFFFLGRAVNDGRARIEKIGPKVYILFDTTG